MNKRLLLWLIPGLLYLLFVTWYTDLGGPLSDQEIEDFTATLEQRGMTAQQISSIQTFMRNDSGRQFLMVNNIDMNENPPDDLDDDACAACKKPLGRIAEDAFAVLAGGGRHAWVHHGCHKNFIAQRRDTAVRALAVMGIIKS